MSPSLIIGKAAKIDFLATCIACLFTGTLCFSQKNLQPDVSHPFAFIDENKKIQVFVLGMNRELVQRTFDGQNWGGWKNHGGEFTASPTATSSKPGRIDILVRNRFGHLAYNYLQNGRLSEWIDLGGNLTSAPSAVSSLPGRIDVFYRGVNGNVLYRYYQNEKWSRERDLGGHLNSEPYAIITGPTRIHLYASNIKNHLIHRKSNGSSWDGWEDLGRNNLASAPSAAVKAPNEIHVVYKGPNGELLHGKHIGNRLIQIKDQGGELTAAPAATILPSGQVIVFIRGRNDNLMSKNITVSGFSNWQNLGGNLYGKTKATLRILTHNIFGLAGKDCGFRLRQIGLNVAKANPSYDIVGLQEFYSTFDLDIKTCDQGNLSDAIRSTGLYKNSRNYYRFYPEVAGQADGGIGIFSLHPISMFKWWQWENDVRTFLAASGFIFSRIPIANTDVVVDVYIVHLNSGGGNDNRNRRKKQLEQLAVQISRLSANSGNPVIVMGDFNIGGPPDSTGNKGYPDIMRILKNPEDLWMTVHPEDHGATVNCRLNNIERCNDHERIDYIFVMKDRSFTNSRYILKVPKSDQLRVINWRVKGFKNFPLAKPTDEGYNVSDHFGVEATIEIRDK